MFILSAVGPDRPGMAHAVALVLFDLGCNIEDTTMTRLSGQFAMILAFDAPVQAALADLERALAPLQQSHGLTLDVAPVSVVDESQTDALRFILTAYGPEKTGLLARLTGVLAEHGANVTDVQTRVASAGSVYVMLLELELPPALEADVLEAELRQSAPDLQISLRPLEEETL